MTPLELLILALTLSLDAAIVAAAASASHRLSLRRALVVAGTFGIFHAAMPMLGLLLGIAFKDELLAYGNVVSAVLLALVGLKMLYDALAATDEDPKIAGAKTLLILGFATSLDVFVVGIGFAFIDVNALTASLTVGIATFLMSLLGAYIGSHSRHIAGDKIQILGAVVILALAAKILLLG